MLLINVEFNIPGSRCGLQELSERRKEEEIIFQIGIFQKTQRVEIFNNPATFPLKFLNKSWKFPEFIFISGRSGNSLIVFKVAEKNNNKVRWTFHRWSNKVLLMTYLWSHYIFFVLWRWIYRGMFRLIAQIEVQ